MNKWPSTSNSHTLCSPGRHRLLTPAPIPETVTKGSGRTRGPQSLFCCLLTFFPLPSFSVLYKHCTLHYTLCSFSLTPNLVLGFQITVTLALIPDPYANTSGVFPSGRHNRNKRVLSCPQHFTCALYT